MCMRYSLKYQVANFLRSKGHDFKEAECPEIIEMQKEIKSLGKGIDFEVKVYPDGSWLAKSPNVEGLLSGGRKQSEINGMLKDAIFTYYGIPAQYANDKILRNTNEPVTVDQRVHVTA